MEASQESDGALEATQNALASICENVSSVDSEPYTPSARGCVAVLHNMNTE